MYNIVYESAMLNLDSLTAQAYIVCTMNRLPNERRTQIISALIEGCSIRATCRLTGAAKGTVTRLLEQIGEACAEHHHANVRDVHAKKVQCDEVWSYVGAKEKNVRPERKGEGLGDAWTYIAIDVDTKLVITWYVGRRDSKSSYLFASDLADRLADRVQLTTDGFHLYPVAIERAFGWGGADYAQLIKTYGASDDSSPNSRYSPPKCNGTIKEWQMGKPAAKHICTSHVERQNLTVRMQNRRFTRLTNAFSKKFENHCHALALHFLNYNFCRKHQTLTKNASGIHTTPAMAAGLTNHVWKIEEILALMEPTRPTR